MHVREATPADAPAVRRVAAASWHAAHDDALDTDTVDELLARWYDVDDLRDSIAASTPPMFVAEDDRLAGFAQGSETDEGPADAAVSRIYVHPDRWGEGCGSELLARLFDALRAAGNEDVWLAVLAENDVGRSFYDDHAFEVHEERTVELAGESVDDVVLVREL